MSSDIRDAFSHPAARAEATAGSVPADRLSLRDHVVEADIGAFQTERGRRQRLRFNLVLEVRPTGPVDDDVDRIVSYDTLTDAVAVSLAVERVNLLETLAERIASRLLGENRALRCFVRVEKLDRGPGALGVEIVRASPDVPVADTPPPRPVVVFLSAPAIASDRLGLWLDDLDSRPAVLCVDAPDGMPKADVAAAQRRIALLAIEQNAWVLAGRDRRCVVVSSRTELDWALRQRRTVVWAPSKMVLDATGAPPGADPAALCAWLAERLDSERLIFVGAAAPEGFDAAPVSIDADALV